MTDLTDRVTGLQQRLREKHPVPRSPTEPNRNDLPEEDRHVSRRDRNLPRIQLATKDGYKGCDWNGLARMAWARHRAGITTDELDQKAMSIVTERDAKW